jgi:hypothetical protein
MGVAEVHLWDDLKRVIERQVAEGHASNEADFLAQAARFYAEHLEVMGEIAAMVERADADIAAGRYAVVADADDSRALHDAAMIRLRARMADRDDTR